MCDEGLQHLHFLRMLLQCNYSIFHIPELEVTVAISCYSDPSGTSRNKSPQQSTSESENLGVPPR